MQLPNIVKQIGKTDGEERVYVEDYVYTYLNELKKEKEIFPVRVALFGSVFQKDEKNFYLVYGASCVIDELECGRDEEQVRKEYFGEHELIGYVNIYGKNHELPGKPCRIIYYSATIKKKRSVGAAERAGRSRTHPGTCLF